MLYIESIRFFHGELANLTPNLNFVHYCNSFLQVFEDSAAAEYSDIFMVLIFLVYYSVSPIAIRFLSKWNLIFQGENYGQFFKGVNV